MAHPVRPFLAGRWPRATLALLALCAAAPGLAADAPEPKPADAEVPGGTPARAPPPEDVARVLYVPETVQARMREQVKEEVMSQAKSEGWGAPDWIRRFHLGGDFRGRFERAIFPRGNANGGEFPDFNAVNTGKPLDVNFVDTANERYLNVDQNRTRPRLRARLEVDVDLGQDFTFGLRIATGDGGSPVSTNQTLGGSGGDFSKYQLWLDRAFLRYEPLRGARWGLAVEAGRFENPFFATDLLWSENVNVDGIALRGRFHAGGGISPFLAGGAFPVFTSAFAFPPERSDKFRSLDKWLYALQLGLEWKLGASFTLKAGAAIYDFERIEGRISRPCDTHLKDESCDTDESRPPFAQKGNTYMALRTPSDSALVAEALGLAPQYQYFGLASPFREVALTARLEMGLSPRLNTTLEGEWVRNVAFSRTRVAKVALNNRGRCDPTGRCDAFDGGGIGWMGRVAIGTPTQDRRWDWRVGLSYRRLESDAVVDAFTDSDFGLGGTNLKGFALAGALSVADPVAVGVRWMSADSVAGPRYAVDTFQLDVTARF
jgi:hypothetical protein